MRAHAEGRFELVVSKHLLRELEGVLARPKFRPYLTAEQARHYVGALGREAQLAEDPGDPEAVSEDPGDDYLVALVRVARAHVLVSGDPHLTSLQLPGLRVATPREFLDRLP